MFILLITLSIQFNPPYIPFDFSKCQNITEFVIFEDGSYQGGILPRQVLLDMCTGKVEYFNSTLYNNKYIYTL